MSTAKELNFRPYTVFLGIVLGTLFAIAFCTSIVGLVFWLLGDEEPRLASEIGPLIEITAIFFVLTVFAGLSFLGSLKIASWRYIPMGALWLGLLMAGGYYWP